MKSLAELQAIKEKMKDKVILREGSADVRVVVGMATCGIAAGARPVLNTIVEQVNLSVQTLTNCLTDSLNFLEHKVMEDYNEFNDNSAQYSDATQRIEDFMKLANNEVKELELSFENIAEAMDGINNNVSECSLGVSDIAAKTSQVVSQTAETFTHTTDCKILAEKLSDITSQFQL